MLIYKGGGYKVSACICLSIACAGLSSFDLLFSKVWGDSTCNCRKKPSLIGQLSSGAKTASCSETGNSQNTPIQDFIHVSMHNPATVYIWNDLIHTGNALGL